MFSFSNTIKNTLPGLTIHGIESVIVVQKSSELFWQQASALLKSKAGMEMSHIKNIPEIASSRKAYKLLGKEPSRYRLSAEALHRRLIKGTGLSPINNVVDIVNYISLKSGFSIGAYDRNKIFFPVLVDRGRKSDSYISIGRGELNIENMPVLRDQQGVFGSPTTDSERSMIDLQTTHILLVFWDFAGHSCIHDTLAEMRELLYAYADAERYQLNHYPCS